MQRLGASIGELFGSVALRYRQPCCAPSGVLAAVRGRNRFFLRGEPDEEILRGEGRHARSAVLARLEAVLFLSDQPQGSRKLAQLAALADGTQARTLVRALNRLYDAEGMAFRIEEVAGGFQLMTRWKFAPWLRRLHTAPVEVRLSAPAMETLAVVAYRQPVLRADVEAVRGVQCGEILRQLIERDLVRIAGRSEELGRPFLYGTTKKFLQVFGLRHLDELPRRELLRIPESSCQDAETAVSDAGPTEKETSKKPIHLYEAEEEKNVRILTTTRGVAEEHPDAAATPNLHPEQDELPGDDFPLDDDHDDDHDDEHDDFDEIDDEEDDEDDDYDDYDEEEDEEEEEEEEADDFEDNPWEEVGDENGEEEEEDEDFDDDWDDDEAWDDDELWEEDDSND